MNDVIICRLQLLKRLMKRLMVLVTAMVVELTFSSPLEMSEFERGKKALQFIEDVTKNADEVQGKLLADILTQNRETEYLTRHGLGGATDREAFKAKVPVVRYEDLREDIERIANGDRSPILSSHPISEFLTSSGTSRGERKLIPGVEKERAQKPIIDKLSMPVMNKYFSGLNKGKGLYFCFVKSETTTPCGLPARTALTSYYKSDYFRDPARRPYNIYTSPIEAILCPDIFQSMYAQILCGLLQKEEVLRVGAVFPSGILRAVHFLQLNWRQLACDVETGTLFLKITDPSIREAVTKLMKPHPELAQFITSECSKGKWEGIISRMWPNTKYIDVIVTGSMAQYIPKLDYYSGGLPLASTLYASSECYFGINLRPICKPGEISYLILPNMAYFEFLPLDDTSSSPNEKHEPPPFQPVDLVDVQIGKEYEIVITTYAGLYRYRVGDVLQVTGFHNSAPLFRFVRRRDVLLSIDADKTNEVELQAAVEKASELLKEFETSVVEYTSHADTNTIPGHYVIYWELSVNDSAKAPSHQVMEKCCLFMEESLNSVYRQSRVADKSIGALEIRVVRNGTFEELMEYAISRGASMNQYKVPRCVSFTPIMHMLNSRVLSTHFSPECPKWTPQRKG